MPPVTPWTRHALVGAVAWLGWLGWQGRAVALAGWSLTWLLLGALVAVPLALAVVQRVTPPAGRTLWLRRLHLPCALLLFASAGIPAGTTAWLLAMPWLLFTLLVALCGVLRFVERGGGPVGELAIDAGMVLLAVGGVWTVAARAGTGLLGFAEPWVTLTAVHFHFAGLVLPVVTGELACRLPGRHGAAAAVGAMAGVPLVAFGITAAQRGGAPPWVEGSCAVLLVGAAALTALLLLRLAAGAARLPRGLAALAGVSLMAGMALVLVYAISRWRGVPRLDLRDMVQIHAPCNAIGFGLLALLALRLLPWRDGVPGVQVVLPWLGDRPAPERWQGRPFQPLVEKGQRGYAADRHRADLPAEPPGPPVPEGPFRRAAAAVLAYRSFPPGLLVGLREAVPVREGEVVVARYRLLPGVHLVFAARVIEVFDEAGDGEHRTGFTYRTLQGHPEAGQETFQVVKDLRTGAVRAELVADSRPGTVLTALLRPLCRRLQLAAGRAAARNLAAIAGGR